MINFEFVEKSTDNVYPKTLLIHNTKGGGVWQVYHIDNEYQTNTIVEGAKAYGFMYITLEDYDPTAEETFPTWREEMAEAYALMLPNHLALKEISKEEQLAIDLYDYSAE